MIREKRQNTVKIIILTIFACGIFALLFNLFYCQILELGDRYISDIKDHLRIALEGRGYSLLYRVLEFVHKFLGGNVGVAVLQCLMIFITWLGTAKLITVLYKGWKFLRALIVALPAVFVSAIYFPGFYGRFYSGQLVTQPYHNITFYGMRMFAVLAMIYFAKMFEKYLEGIKFIDWILAAGFLACSTSVKPSFFYGFALALLIFLVIDFVKTKFKAKPFLKMVIIGLIVIPSLVIMAIQATKLYGKPVESGGSGIAIVWGKSLFTQGFAPLFKLGCGIGFPCLVAAMNFKHLNRFEKFSYAMFIMQFVINIMFTETGERASHGNFAWGVYSAGFFLFIITFSRFADDLRNYKNKNKLYLILGTILAIAHIVSAVCYFIHIVLGGSYAV